MDLKDEAEELAIALELDLISVEDVVQWADNKIMQLAEPPFYLIDLSISGQLPGSEIAHCLRMFPGIVNTTAVLRAAMMRMFSLLENSSVRPEIIAKALYVMHLNGWIPDDEASSEMISLDDEFGLVQQGIRTYDSATNRLRAFLSRYCS